MDKKHFISKEERLKRLDGVDTSSLPKSAIGVIMGNGLNNESLRRFLWKHEIPSKTHNPATINPVIHTKDSLTQVIFDLEVEGTALTYENIGRHLGFTKQRARELCLKHDLIEHFRSAKIRQKTK